jgi:carbon-monoxide dehydrogenase medium subunit
MKNFNYFRPKTLDEATSLLSNYKDEAKIIAGGQSLLVLMKERLVTPKYLIDISEIPELKFIKEEQGIKIGALTTHREIEKSPVIKEKFPVLIDVEKNIASPHIRNVGTIGGNLCHADPTGDPAPVMIGLGATLKIVKKGGERTMLLENFFKGYLETALEPDEILTEIYIPYPSSTTGIAYKKHALRNIDTAIVNAATAVSFESGDGICKDVRIVIGGVASTPVRAKRGEEILKGKNMDDTLIEEVARSIKDEIAPISDIHASEWYRKEMIELLTKEILIEAKRAIR